MNKILVIEDDLLLNKTLCYNLSKEGYDTDSAASAQDGCQRFMHNTYALVVLDVNLPDGDGFDLCRQLKVHCKDTAVIFLTARDMEEDMLKGFDLGGDDYVTKPFPISVFLKKIQRLLIRSNSTVHQEIYDDGALVLDFAKMEARLNGRPVTFTALEYRILRLMTANAGMVLTRQVLLEKLWDAEENFVDEHALTSAISRIRKKLESDGDSCIKTVYGMGYMWIGGVNK